jgi:hypothetical protein
MFQSVPYKSAKSCEIKFFLSCAKFRHFFAKFFLEIFLEMQNQNLAKNFEIRGNAGREKFYDHVK